ncbi:MAG TPA: hypothetical protein ENH62_13070 [Marinobacter sp.]|uniref:NlpC/P60 domain-containing protein n=1 Tax=marine sediment metagenome TaxID=412755 RepID=A0A0F9SAE7_9ZZZZ|nr:hypothetical protein [Marinobacter sp.]
MISFADIIGKPYRTDGAGPNMFGCWGLARFVACRVGIELPSFPVPDALDKRNALFVHVRNGGDFVKLDTAEPWAIATFLIKDDYGKLHWHVGTVLEDMNKFIHTIKKGGVCISRLDDPLWSLFCEGFYKYDSR